MNLVELVGADFVDPDRVLTDAVGSDLRGADGILGDLEAADCVGGDLRLAHGVQLDLRAADAICRDLRPANGVRLISGLPTPSVAISELPTEPPARSIAARPPPVLSSSRTSAERTPLLSEMSFDVTWPLTMSSLNTVFVAGSATAVPLRATKSAR